MNTAVKNKWIERLRSGEIPQLEGSLGDEDGSRCCLGKKYLKFGFHHETSFLPQEDQEWAGVTTEKCYLKTLIIMSGERIKDLKEANDFGFGFKQSPI